MPKVAIIMGSDSDFPSLKGAIKILKEYDVEVTVRVMSAHRTPDEVEYFAKNAASRGVKVIIAGAGMAAHLCGVIAAMTSVPVIGVPINASLDGMDALLAIVQMPPGIPVATVAINGAQNAAILAAQMIATGDVELAKKLIDFKENLKQKIVSANKELEAYTFDYRVI
jgi:5-(carboxyamino)imidazole ribonucleotide mutase